MPSGLATGPDYQYSLTARQVVGGGPVLLPPYTGGADPNPETIFFG
jgi:hypothetical protein